MSIKKELLVEWKKLRIGSCLYERKEKFFRHLFQTKSCLEGRKGLIVFPCLYSSNSFSSRYACKKSKEG